MRSGAQLDPLAGQIDPHSPITLHVHGIAAFQTFAAHSRRVKVNASMLRAVSRSHFFSDSAGHHVFADFFPFRAIAQHEAFAFPIAQNRAFKQKRGNHTGSDQSRRPKGRAWLELDKFHIAHPRACLVSHSHAVAAGVSFIGRNRKNPAVSTAGQHDRFRSHLRKALIFSVIAQRPGDLLSVCGETKRPSFAPFIYAAFQLFAQGFQHCYAGLISNGHDPRMTGAQRTKHLIAVALPVKGKIQRTQQFKNIQRILAKRRGQFRRAQALPALQGIFQKAGRRILRVHGRVKPVHPGRSPLPILDDQRPQTGQHAFVCRHPACQTAAKDQTIRSTHDYTSQMPPLAMEPTFLENSRRKRW